MTFAFLCDFNYFLTAYESDVIVYENLHLLWVSMLISYAALQFISAFFILDLFRENCSL